MHSEEQRGVVAGLLESVGLVGALVAYQSPAHGGMTLLDGHLRQDIAGDQVVDVLEVDLTDAEAELVLATYDRVGRMATYDDDILRDILSGADISPDLNLLFADLQAAAPDELDIAGLDSLDDQAAPAKPKYELVPNLDEGYDFVAIFCRRQTEYATLATLLDLPTKKYKSGRVGTSHVLTYQEFIARWNARQNPPAGLDQ